MAAITPQPLYGESRVHFVKAQTTFDTHIAMAATDGFKCIKMKLDPEQKWEDLKEANGHGSKVAPIKGKRGGKFSAKFHMMPQTAGTPMDSGPFLKSAFGTETGSVYTLSATANPIQLAECAIGESWEEGSGGVVEQLVIDVPSNDAPTIEASGQYARHIWSRRGSSSGVASPATVIPVTAGHDGNWSVDAYVDLEGSGNTNRAITAVTPATPSITIGSGLTTTLSADATIIPYCPTPTTAGNYIPVGGHALLIDSVAYGFISGKFTLKTGFHLGDKESGSDRANRIFHGPQELAFEIQMYWFDAKQSALLGKAWDGTTHTISLRIGENTTAKRYTLALPAARLDVSGLDIPDSAETLVTLKGVAQMSAAAFDEATFTGD